MNGLSRAEGALIGLAIGDAIGMQVEFARPGTFEPVTDMGEGGPHGLPSGYWTDDTSMALCLADSLLEKNRFDPTDQLQRYFNWWKHGYRSSTGACFDIGISTMKALQSFDLTQNPYREPPPLAIGLGASNGSLMRLAPIPIAYSHEVSMAVQYSGLSSKTTHAGQECVDACRYFGFLICKAIDGATKDELLVRGGYNLASKYWQARPLHLNVLQVAIGSYIDAEPPVIEGSGYVVKAMEAALWAIKHTDNFRDAILAATNLGDDSDTTAAITGQLAGAIYGIEGILADWLEHVYMGAEIRQIARALYETDISGHA